MDYFIEFVCGDTSIYIVRPRKFSIHDHSIIPVFFMSFGLTDFLSVYHFQILSDQMFDCFFQTSKSQVMVNPSHCGGYIKHIYVEDSLNIKNTTLSTVNISMHPMLCLQHQSKRSS